MRLVYLGSGSFGLPTLERLLAEHEIGLVITQPDRPAGRHRRLRATPVGEIAESHGLELIKTADVNDPSVAVPLLDCEADALITIAFGQKLGPGLLGHGFAVNLHASLLPKYRGAAPVNWAMINGETETGVTVIRMSQRIDAGEMLAQRTVAIDHLETAGELEARLAGLGPEVLIETLKQYREGTLKPTVQDEDQACPARKLTKSDGTVRFDQPARTVQRRVHGLSPWPGCMVRIEGRPLRLARVEVIDERPTNVKPGQMVEDGQVACEPGTIRLLEVQPAGGKTMDFVSYCHGHRVGAGGRLEPFA